MNLREHKTVCPYCGVGCGVILQTGNGRVTGVRGDPSHPSNRGKLCSKGLNLHNTIHLRDRVRHPLIRDSKESAFTSTTWDNALGTIADKFNSLLEEYGPESIAFYVSGQLLTEDYYVVNKLSKGFLKVNNIDSNSRLCMSSAVMGYRRAFGVDAPPCSYEDLRHTDCVFIIGSNMAYCHPVVFMQLAEEKEKKGDALKIIVADPRKTSTAGIADIFIPLEPGTDVALLNSMAHVLIEHGLVDYEYINSYTEGFDALKECVKSYPPEKVSGICGIPADLIIETALTFGRSRAAMTFWAMGLNQSSSGTDKNNALLNLSIMTGNIGKPGAGPFSLTGQANAMGGRETGGLANILPGHRYVANEKHRREVAGVWGVEELSPAVGLTAVDIYDEMEKGVVKAVWIICTNPVVSLPNGSKVERALKKAGLVVVQDIFHPTDTSVYADIVLPAAGFSEKEGTMTNQERRIAYISKAVEPPGEALPDWRIFTLFARKIGLREYFDYEKAEDIFEEYKKLNKGRDVDISGVTYERLKNEGPLQWPCPEAGHPGTPRLYTEGKFHTDSGKARFISAEYISQKEATDDEYPLVLTTGRIRDQWHTMTKTGKVESLMMSEPEPVLDINPADAERYGLKDGELTLLESRRGKAVLKCSLTDKIKRGSVFMPFHWGRLMGESGRANLLTVEETDRLSHQPEFKACAVRVSKKFFDDELDIVIIGDDSYSNELALRISGLNANANVTILGMSGNAPNGSVKQSPVDIDIKDRKIRLADGSFFYYDKLVFAPGNKTYLPSIKGLSCMGIRVFDSFNDAKMHIAREHVLGKAVVVGTKPFSLETAEFLKMRGAEEVSFISPRNILLDKYVDYLGSRLLYKKLRKKGINIILGAEIGEITASDNNKFLVTANGVEIEADLVFVESVTRPDLDVALRTGLLVNRGICAGEHLETNLPDVYTMGRAAEVKGVMAEDSELLDLQSEVLSRCLCGDPTARYDQTMDANRFTLLGLDIVTFGQFNADDERTNVISYLDKSQAVYKKIVIRDNRIAGGLYMGDVTGAEEVLRLAREKSDISKYRDTLLSGKFKEKLPTGRVVCSCMSVTEFEIKQAVKNGASSVEALKDRLKVAVTCGSCLEEVKELFAECRAAR
ncbi:MAG TPA: formate dehydrogenase subunit alpha [Thermodesulfobacteriota bacterium]|nr:formate dehydrogenase subunit alpha [Thermodesulfobacteriota bacterium]